MSSLQDSALLQAQGPQRLHAGVEKECPRLLRMLSREIQCAPLLPGVVSVFGGAQLSVRLRDNLGMFHPLQCCEQKPVSGSPEELEN